VICRAVVGVEIGFDTAIAALALLVSLGSLYFSVKSSRAANRSADAAEEANQYSRKSADAAALSGEITRTAFENEAKRSKAYAYWRLHRLDMLLGDVPGTSSLAAVDLSPIQEFLHVYGHT
jgi:hypothetical protein